MEKRSRAANGGPGAATHSFHEFSGTEQAPWSVISRFFPVLGDLSLGKFLHQNTNLQIRTVIFCNPHEPLGKTQILPAKHKSLVAPLHLGYLCRLPLAHLHPHPSTKFKRNLSTTDRMQVKSVQCRENSSKILYDWECHFKFISVYKYQKAF